MAEIPMMTRRSALAVGVLGVAGNAVAETVGVTGTEHILARNKAQLELYYDEIFNKRDLSRADEFLSPKLSVNGRNLAGDYVGFFQNVFWFLEENFDEVAVSPDQIIADGNWVAGRYRAKTIFYPRGRTDQNTVGVPVEMNGMGFYEFDENGLMINNMHIEDGDQKLSRISAEYAQKQQSDVESRNKEQARRFYAEFISAQDISKADDFLSPHFTMDDRGDDGVQEKPKDPIEHFRVLFKLIAEGASEFVLTPDEMVAEGNTVAVRWHQTALLRPKEPVEQNPVTQRLNWTGTSFLEFDQNGLIVKARVLQIEDKAKKSE